MSAGWPGLRSTSRTESPPAPVGAGDAFFSFIKENSCSHRYVLPNIERVWAPWMRSWGIISGMNRANWAAPTESYFAFGVSLRWSSISSICMCEGALSVTTANVLMSSWNLLFALENRQIGGWIRLQVVWVFRQTLHQKHDGWDLPCHALAAG